MKETLRFKSLCSLHKVSEGGSLTQKEVKSIARNLGIRCRVGSDLTIYVGHFGVDIDRNTPLDLEKDFLKQLGL